jgi:hypothetical protein
VGTAFNLVDLEELAYMVELHTFLARPLRGSGPAEGEEQTTAQQQKVGGGGGLVRPLVFVLFVVGHKESFGRPRSLCAAPGHFVGVAGFHFVGRRGVDVVWCHRQGYRLHEMTPKMVQHGVIPIQI